MFRVALQILLAVLASSTFTVSHPAQLEGRIVGGELASISKHPYQISLRHKHCKECEYEHHCGGSIYSKDVIITAAHCVNKREANRFIVVAGTDNREGADGAVVRVDKIVMHDKYNASIVDNDIALVFLSSSLPLNDATIKPIPLAAIPPRIGERATVSGWGMLTPDEESFLPYKLQDVEVPIWSKVSCEAAYGKSKITESMLCAGYIGVGGKDACQGDSGGPLVVNEELVGVVSWGRSCASPEYPGIYANVVYLKSWIEDTVNKNSISLNKA